MLGTRVLCRVAYWPLARTFRSWMCLRENLILAQDDSADFSHSLLRRDDSYLLHHRMFRRCRLLAQHGLARTDHECQRDGAEDEEHHELIVVRERDDL